MIYGEIKMVIINSVYYNLLRITNNPCSCSETPKDNIKIYGGRSTTIRWHRSKTASIKWRKKNPGPINYRDDK